MAELYELKEQMNNFDIKIRCYMVELYLNELRDLLLPKGKPQEEI